MCVNPIFKNKENVPDEPLLFVGNHFSFMDPVMLAMALPEKQIHFMAKKELFTTGREVINQKQIDYLINNEFSDLLKLILAYPNALSKQFFSSLISSVGVFPIDRNGNDTKAVKETIKLLKAERDVAIYPEGTRNKRRDYQPLLPFETGIDGISILSKRRIQPFAVSGNYRFGKAVLSFGQPFKLERDDNKYRWIYQDFERVINKTDFTIELEEEIKKLILIR